MHGATMLEIWGTMNDLHTGDVIHTERGQQWHVMNVVKVPGMASVLLANSRTPWFYRSTELICFSRRDPQRLKRES
jgi:hypothetical protein